MRKHTHTHDLINKKKKEVRSVVAWGKGLGDSGKWKKGVRRYKLAAPR